MDTFATFRLCNVLCTQQRKLDSLYQENTRVYFAAASLLDPCSRDIEGRKNRNSVAVSWVVNFRKERKEEEDQKSKYI